MKLMIIIKKKVGNSEAKKKKGDQRKRPDALLRRQEKESKQAFEARCPFFPWPLSTPMLENEVQFCGRSLQVPGAGWRPLRERWFPLKSTCPGSIACNFAASRWSRAAPLAARRWIPPHPPPRRPFADELWLQMEASEAQNTMKRTVIDSSSVQCCAR